MLTYINLLLFVPAIVAGTHEASRQSFDKRTLFVADSEPNVRRSAQTGRTCTSTPARDSCAQCFGAGFINCPGSTILCYEPGSTVEGIDSCPGTPAFASSPSTSTIVNITPPSPTITRFGENCAAAFGSGSITCATDPWCYNPSQGEVCCADGHYCNAGETCSLTPGYCEYTVESGATATRLASVATHAPAVGGTSTSSRASTSYPSASLSTSTYSYPPTSSQALVYPTPPSLSSSPTPSARYTGRASALSASISSLVLLGTFVSVLLI